MRERTSAELRRGRRFVNTAGALFVSIPPCYGSERSLSRGSGDSAMDSDIPVPSDVPMPQAAQTVLIAGMTVMALVSLGYAINASIRRRDLVHIWLLLGAGLAIPYEALGDNLVHVYYTERGQISWVTTFGHSIPAFIGILYFWYLTIFAYVMIRRARTGMSGREFWLCWSGFCAFAIFFEMLVTSVGGHTWIYYGPQAFMVG